ncbi:hypothetical protein EBQ90_07510 [bacterium]|nr:hypothetical protein [bacterium]
MQHWESTLQAIQAEIPAPQFQRWFKELAFLRQDGDTLFVGVPSAFHQEWLSSHYKDQLHRAISKNFGSPLQLEFEVLVEDSNREASQSISVPVAAPVAQQKPQLRVVEGGVKLSESLTEDAFPQSDFDSQLPSFSGDFFELNFNRLCVQLCGLFVQGQTSSLSSLFISAGIGMGKTHLLSKLGTEIKKSAPHLKVRYTSAEKFTNEMFKSWNNKSGPNYQMYYRDQVDVLLFDDLQGLAGRKATQEALLHIYNEILSRGGRLVFTSTETPHKLSDFIEPLRSRLLSGVAAEIKIPSYEEKVCLLSLLAQQNQIPVEESLLRVLADHGHRDVREMLGAFLRLHLQSHLEKKALDLAFLAKTGLPLETAQQAISINEIIALVENCFGISKTDLVSKSRKGLIVWARQVAMYLGRRFTLHSLEEIGKFFGRDHATVLYAYEKVSETLREQPTKRYEVEFLMQKLQARMSKPENDFLL